jgi:hypothetical protein
VTSEERRAYYRAWGKQPANREKVMAYKTSWRAANAPRMLLEAAKTRAKLRGIPFNLTLKDIVIPETCPVFGIPLTRHIGKGRMGGREDSPSLDRIDNTKGYTRDNVQVISRLANAMKSSANRQQLIAFAHWVLSR